MAQRFLTLGDDSPESVTVVTAQGNRVLTPVEAPASGGGFVLLETGSEPMPSGAGVSKGPFLRPTSTMVVGVLAWPDGTFTGAAGIGDGLTGGVQLVRRIYFDADGLDTYRVWLENTSPDDLVFRWAVYGINTVM
jgi:hypothetical protein